MAVSPNPEIARLRVGVIGHRPNHALAADLADRIAAAFGAIDRLAQARGFAVSLLSGLAEGADQIAAERRPAGWKLGAVLPFARAEYEKDFETSAWKDGRDALATFRTTCDRAERVVALDAARADAAAYERAGLYLLRNVDVLVAVWDGASERGLGGTGALVPAAAQFGLPTIWIASEGDAAPRLILGRRHDGGLEIATGDALGDRLAEAIGRIVDPQSRRSAGGESGRGERTDEAKRRDFLAEPWRPDHGMPYYRAFQSLVSRKASKRRKPRKPPEEQPDAWKEFLDAAPEAGALRSDIETRLLPAFLKADGLAVYFGNNYRSAYVLTYVMSFVAVGLALLGLIIPHEWPEGSVVSIKAGLVAVELAVIFGILRIVKKGGEERWHERWLDYRALAEMLRHIRFLAFIGEHRQLGHEAARPETERSLHWTVRYARDVARSIGLPQATIDKRYLARLLDVVGAQELHDQILYHRRAEENLSHLHETLHWLGEWCFRLTLYLLAAFFAVWLIDVATSSFMPKHPAGEAGCPCAEGEAVTYLTHVLYVAKSYLGVAAAALPALGAALSGIRFTGEFETVAARSRAMVGALRDLRARAEGLAENPTFDATAETLVDVAGVMAADIETFQTLYGYKRLALPG